MQNDVKQVDVTITMETRAKKLIYDDDVVDDEEENVMNVSFDRFDR